MGFFILGLLLGVSTGVVLMAMLQVNRYEEIEKNNKEVEE